jgi:linoleoyl-CoA desaturase
MHYTAGLILSVVFQLAHVVEETTNPSPNELEKWIILKDSSIVQTIILRLKRNCKLVHRWVKPSNRTSYISKHQSHSLRYCKIVRETAQECNLPYYEKQCVQQLLHFKHLKELEKPEMA